jgi:hypothetical protein
LIPLFADLSRLPNILLQMTILCILLQTAILGMAKTEKRGRRRTAERRRGEWSGEQRLRKEKSKWRESKTWERELLSSPLLPPLPSPSLHSLLFLTTAF